MGKLELNFSWSNSRVNLFRECLRKYYYNYIASWGGWNAGATEEQKRAYLLKNITNIYLFRGDIVHKIIEKILKDFRSTGQWMSLQDAQQQAIQMLNDGWKQSKTKQWKHNIKNNVNLFEHYYNEPLSKAEIEFTKTLVLECLKTFYDLEIVSVVKTLDKKDFLSLEDFQKFQLNTGESVSLKIDFAFKHSGKIYLTDWKSGKPNNNVIEQLISYAIYAVKKGFTDNLANARIVPIYLAATVHGFENIVQELEVTLPQASCQAKIIREESKLLFEAHKNQNNPDWFEFTENRYLCKKCNFKEICPNARRN